ncbi:hypothetical protein D3C73_1511500 [compost metagenome]
MPVERDHQRQRLGSNHFHMVIGADVLLPERRQMHLFGVQIIAPFIGFIAGQPIAGNGVGNRVDVVALRRQRQFGRRQ